MEDGEEGLWGPRQTGDKKCKGGGGHSTVTQTGSSQVWDRKWREGTAPRDRLGTGRHVPKRWGDTVRLGTSPSQAPDRAGSAWRSKTQAEDRSGGRRRGGKGQEMVVGGTGLKDRPRTGSGKGAQVRKTGWGQEGPDVGGGSHRDPGRLETDPSQVWDRKWKEGCRDRRGCGAQTGWGQDDTHTHAPSRNSPKRRGLAPSMHH